VVRWEAACVVVRVASRKVSKAKEYSEGDVSTEKCQHAHRISAKLDLDFTRPSDSKARYTAVVSVGICEACGHIEFYAAQPRLLCDWLEPS
jgi:hypothetical protein